MAIGRPTDYRPEYCKMLIEHMQSGLSFESFAAIADVHKETLYEWANVHPAFSEAKKKGFSKNLLYMEKLGQQGMWNDKDGAQFNTTNWIFQMKNRHRWRDRHEVETVDKTDIEREKIKKMSMSELTALVKENLDK